jgi:hypothetical protein
MGTPANSIRQPFHKDITFFKLMKAAVCLIAVDGPPMISTLFKPYTQLLDYNTFEKRNASIPKTTAAEHFQTAAHGVLFDAACFHCGNEAEMKGTEEMKLQFYFVGRQAFTKYLNDEAATKKLMHDLNLSRKDLESALPFDCSTVRGN